MQINNNPQSPNFGMAFHVKSKSGVMKYIDDVPEKIEEIYKFAAESKKADLKQTRRIEQKLRENGISIEELSSSPDGKKGMQNYLPDTVIDNQGNVTYSSSAWGYKGSRAVNPESETFGNMSEYNDCCRLWRDRTLGSPIKTDYDAAYDKFLADLRERLNDIAAAARARRIDNAADNIASKFSIDG